MEVRHDEGVAIRIDPEPCADASTQPRRAVAATDGWSAHLRGRGGSADL